jgi:pimeloyl-ACP methyl ester carboxylesterase
LKVNRKFIQIVFLAAIFFGLFSPITVHAQTSSLTVEILDKDSRPITQIVDGNRIQLRVTFIETFSIQTPVDFLLDDQVIASCLVPVAETNCTTEFVETLGWFWAKGGVSTRSRRIQAKAGNEAAEIVVDISPRPVVLVHGLISTAEKFNVYINYLESIGLQGYAAGDGQFKGVLKMGDISNPAAPTLTIVQNAAQLDTYIDGVKRSTGAEQVDLLAHSMGGLVSRYYIHELMAEDDVAQLIMLGTPNGGSTCGGLLSSLGFFLPATLELQPGYLNNIFNRQITNTRGVPFHAVAGSFINDPAFSPCSGVPSDSSVSQASVQAVSLHLAGIPALEHNLLVTDEAAFKGLIQPLLQTPADGFAASPAIQPASVPVPGQFTQTYTGHLDKNASTSITIEIDAGVNVASFGLYDSTQSLQISVKGASGKTLELDLDNKGVVITDPETMLYLGYGFETPKPGAWVVTLSTSERTPSTGADYALYARFDGGAKLNAQVDELIPEIGQVLHLSASLEGGQIESALVNILLPNGASQPIQPSFSGNQATAEFIPQQKGLHGIEIMVTGVAADGFRIDRAASLALEAQAAPPSQLRTWAVLLGIITGLILLLALPVTLMIKRRRK